MKREFPDIASFPFNPFKKPFYSLVPTAVMPLAPFGTPVLNPFLNLRETSFMWRMRPVPVVFLLFAFSPQLSVGNGELVFCFDSFE